MEKPTLKDTLRALAQDDKRRTKIGRLREVFADIQAAQAAGVSNAKIVAALNAEHGLGLSLKTFETMLYRLRKEATSSARPAAPAAPVERPRAPGKGTPPAAPPPDETTDDDPEETGHLTMKQQGERLADRFMSPSTTNPILKKLTKETK